MSGCYFFIDTETTGLNWRQHRMIEFGGLKVLDGVIVSTLDIKIDPGDIRHADERALQINGYTPEKWERAISQEDAAGRISRWLDQPGLLVGHNVWFDRQFITKAMTKDQMMNVPFRKICTKDLSVALLSQYGLDSFRLQAVCEFLGVANDNPHSAFSDARACFEVFRRLNPVDPYARFLIHQWLGLHGPGELPDEIIRLL